MAGIDDAAAGNAAGARQLELTPMERVEQKLIACGVPEEQLQEHQEGMLMYMEEHKVSEITAAILSAGTDLAESRKSPIKKDNDNTSSNEGGDGMYGESLSWLQWMMFDNELAAVLDDMEASCTEERAVCGSFWG